jgi:hypothetical protein
MEITQEYMDLFQAFLYGCITVWAFLKGVSSV